MSATTVGATRAALEELIQRELAAIGAIEATMREAGSPEDVALYRDLREKKQVAVEQMSTLVRRAGGDSPTRAGIGESGTKFRSSILARIAASTAVRVFRDLERELERDYEAFRTSASDSLEAEAFRTLAERACVTRHVLTAQLARREEAGEEGAALPEALDRYFAGARARVCMRCMLDRPGVRSALERTGPSTYVCAACHDEVLGGFSPDLRPLVECLPPHEREARVIQKALGRPETVKARNTVLRALSGLPPIDSTLGVTPRHRAPGATGPAASGVEPAPLFECPRDEASPAELAYTDRLFDYSTVRRNW